MGMRSIWKPGQSTDKGQSTKRQRRKKHMENNKSRAPALGGTCVLARARIATRKIPGWEDEGQEIEDLTGF
eukprot:7843647-Heterocapsa_arctica.AAC.1